jgi:hypothetical protein
MATSYDGASLVCSSVGNDRIFSLLENAQHAGWIDEGQSCDIVKTDDDNYRVFVARVIVASRLRRERDPQIR